MSIIYGGDPAFVSNTVADAEAAAMLAFRPAVSANVHELRVTNAELRAKLGTADGITAAIRTLPELTVDEARELILVLSNRVNRIEGYDTDALCQRLDEAFFVPAPVETVYDPRDHAAEEAADWARVEAKDQA